MFDQLKEIYSSFIPYHDHHKENYQWFYHNQNEIFGIHKDELGENDLQLLSVFFQVYEPSIPAQTSIESLWHQRIYQPNNAAKPKSDFRFVYFSIANQQISAVEFRDALSTLFEKEHPIIWLNAVEGVLIEEFQIEEEEIQFDQIIDILMADLSINIHFFIGAVIHPTQVISNIFHETCELGRKLFQLTNQHVIHHVEATPYLLLDKLNKEDRGLLSTSILKKFYDDNEMIDTLEYYFSCNLNISETAKKMFMHRNSIQYRIDKFTKETGINIQNFNEAMTVKLAILAKFSE